MPASSADLGKLAKEDCVRDIDAWMTVNMFKMNRNKAKSVVLNANFIFNVNFGLRRVISKSSVAGNIGVLYDTFIPMEHHVTAVRKAGFYHLRDGSRIRKYIIRSKYLCMLSFLRDWTSVIYYRNRLSRDVSMFKPLSLNTDIVSKRGYCNCISRSTIGSILLSGLI